MFWKVFPRYAIVIYYDAELGIVIFIKFAHSKDNIWWIEIISNIKFWIYLDSFDILGRGADNLFIMLYLFI